MTEIVVYTEDGIPAVSTLTVADRTGNQHRSIFRLVRENIGDLEDFGPVRFEIAPKSPGQIGGGDTSYALLNEGQAMLVMTYLRNNTVVRAFKKDLVSAFLALREALMSQPLALTEEEIVQRALSITTRKVEELTARVAELEPVARSYLILATANGDVSVADAAKILKRDHGIDIGGHQKLYQYMESQSWVFKEKSTGRWKAYQTQVNMGRLNHKYPEVPYVDARTGELRMGEPTVRVTEKGQHELRMRLSANETTPLPD